MQAFKKISPNKTQFYKQPNLTHLQILGFIVYILPHKKKHLMKLEKWILQILKRILIAYNRHTIYKIHIKE